MTSSVKTTTSDSVRPPSVRPPSIPPPSRKGVEIASDRFQLIDDYFPILLSVSPAHYNETTVPEMVEAFEQYFIRGARYVVIAVSPNHGEPPDAKQRKRVTDWITSPRVMNYSARLCLGSANIVPNALLRGLHTALLWAWNPPFPIQPVADAREALDYSLEVLRKASVPPPRGEPAALRATIQRRLQEIMG